MIRILKGTGTHRRPPERRTAATAAAVSGVAAAVALTTSGTAGAATVREPVTWGMEAGSIPKDTAAGAYVNQQPGIDSWFVGSTATSAPVSTMNAARAAGAIPMIAWSPQGTLDQIQKGQEDTQIIAMAKSFATYGHPFYLRPFAEFNTNWETYSVGETGNTPQSMYGAWRHVERIFRQYAGSNPLFVWTVGYSGATSWLKTAWPGGSYVNYVGIDAYDWCNSTSWCPGEQYRYSSILKTVKSFDQGRLAMLAETGTGLNTSAKGTWLANALRASMGDGIRALVWFDETEPNQPDWRLETAPGAQAAERAALAQLGVASASRYSIGTLERYALTGYWQPGGAVAAGKPATPSVVSVPKPPQPTATATPQPTATATPTPDPTATPTPLPTDPASDPAASPTDPAASPTAGA